MPADPSSGIISRVGAYRHVFTPISKDSNASEVAEAFNVRLSKPNPLETMRRHNHTSVNTRYSNNIPTA